MQEVFAVALFVMVLALILLSVVTAFLSAFLDNVTTVILMVPVTFLIADALESSPMPFLLTQVMASNVGEGSTEK
jgi:Na+/H+ antiporter NhaD/arsenite permease-like protein